MANPLSLSVSNEAVGAYVRESAALERRRLAEEQRRRDGAGRGGGGNGRGRGASETPHRYKTTHLTVSDLRKPPQPWRAFFAATFRVPFYIRVKPTAIGGEARRRLDGNVYEFFALTVAFWVVCSVLYNKPKALVGLVFLLPAVGGQFIADVGRGAADARRENANLRRHRRRLGERAVRERLARRVVRDSNHHSAGHRARVHAAARYATPQRGRRGQTVASELKKLRLRERRADLFD